MFKKENRLPARVRPVFTSSFSTPFFTAKIGSNTLSRNRFSVIVSKKVDARAVARNRIKRVIRECLEKIETVPGTGADVVVIVKKQALTQPKDMMRQFVQEQFGQHGFL